MFFNVSQKGMRLCFECMLSLFSYFIISNIEMPTESVPDTCICMHV